MLTIKNSYKGEMYNMESDSSWLISLLSMGTNMVFIILDVILLFIYF